MYTLPEGCKNFFFKVAIKPVNVFQRFLEAAFSAANIQRLFLALGRFHDVSWKMRDGIELRLDSTQSVRSCAAQYAADPEAPRSFQGQHR
eukprot:g41098.t1